MAPNHFLFEVVPEDLQTTVGYVWFATLVRGASKVAHHYQLYVLEAHRRRGHGRAALAEAEVIALESGHAGLSLNVFAANSVARALYASAGYEAVALSLRQQLR
jgi:ribosomal protein S18 acetylase RimI-like enzyme